MQKILTTFLVVLGVFLGTLAAGVASKIAPFVLNENNSTIMTTQQDVFSVSGTAKIEAVPDEAQVNLGIEAQKMSVAEAQNEVNSVMNKITTELIKLGVKKEEMKTSEYSIYPNYDYANGRKITGYRASATLQVKIKDFALLNQIIDTGSGNGANEIGNISFNLSEEKEREVLKEARKQGIADAKQKAADLASEAGMNLGKIVNVNENNSSAYQPRVMNDMAVLSGAAKSEATEIQGGTTSYSYSVTLSYELQ